MTETVLLWLAYILGVLLTLTVIGGVLYLAVWLFEEYEDATEDWRDPW